MFQTTNQFLTYPIFQCFMSCWVDSNDHTCIAVHWRVNHQQNSTIKQLWYIYIYIYLHHWALTWNIANTDSDFLASVCQNSPMFGEWSFDPLGEIQCFLSNSQLLLESTWFKNHMKTTALGELQILCWSPNGSTRHFSQPSSLPAIHLPPVAPGHAGRVSSPACAASSPLPATAGTPMPGKHESPQSRSPLDGEKRPKTEILSWWM